MLLHGGPAARHNYFLPWVKPLAKSFRLVLYDQCGSGKSGKATDGKYNLPVMVQDLEALRRQLRLGKVNLLGHSWGGSAFGGWCSCSRTMRFAISRNLSSVPGGIVAPAAA